MKIIVKPVEGEGSLRVYSGGSWRSFAWVARVSYRGNFAPFLRDNLLGFRLARNK